ncbi:MAG: DUF4405 domain-containing protein [Planctomycetes bacterium]|nr:DUF4405 domain-containing protein [Planctomycetota bacterium]
MRRSTLNMAVDAVTLLDMLAVAATGLILRFILPPGSRGGAGLQLWEWNRHEWGDLHFYLIVGLGALLLLHIALHWTWVCGVVRAMFHASAGMGMRRAKLLNSLYGGLTLAILVGAFAGFLWIAANNVEGRSLDRQTETPQRAGWQWRGGR